MGNAYEIKNLEFGYNEDAIVSIKSLSIEAGSVIGLAGPNGSGKTTLLSLLAFLNDPWSGSLKFFDEESHGLDKISLRRRVGLLLQHPYMFSTTVMANLTWGLRLRGASKSHSVEKAREALKWVGLEGFEGRDARSLSGGETQRVALARSLVLEPEVLLLDEHANHMDKQSVDRVEQVVMDRNKEMGVTVLFAGHFLERRTQLKPDIIINVMDILNNNY
jgi:tungstate transport system ATP-binding protein